MKTLLHLGSGPIHLDGWVNIDKEKVHAPDLCMDYLDLPTVIPNETVDAIFACHTIEHLPWPEGVERFFVVTHQALKRGGVLRIAVPDLMKVAKLYVSGDDLKGIYDGPFHEGPDTPATRFMYFMRAWNHTIIFDERLLRMLMEAAWFKDIRVMPFGKSDVLELCGIDRFESESLILQCTK